MPDRLIYSAHAEIMLAERGIERDWVKRTVLEPQFRENDPTYPDRQRVFRALPERDGRVLRVVYTMVGDEFRIITLFLDRGRRR